MADLESDGVPPDVTERGGTAGDGGQETINRILDIRNRRGLHARAAAKFVKLAGQYDARVQVSRDGMTVCGDSIMGLMMLAAGCGSSISLAVDGPDAEAAALALAQLVDRLFDED